ncbi:hypothetical protein GCM10011577_40390 [Pseudarthrobacter polychromogenes]|uniref:Transposase n=1 Tax=Pseudarthrobacter polychromogenes TaxID=1676 RepID=A0ABQ1Y4G5_9MICC|nr:hypothetical protein GCM10011577_40390 [Pseudarthrobacter polychromogenes]
MDERKACDRLGVNAWPGYICQCWSQNHGDIPRGQFPAQTSEILRVHIDARRYGNCVYIRLEN